MWDWLKKRRVRPSSDLDALTNRLIKPMSLAVALSECVREYAIKVHDGRKSYPAHRREGVSVVEIWRDLRLEALASLYNFGKSEPLLLADVKRQVELLNCLLDERPHLEFPQPRGAVIPDTIQAMWQTYVYLNKVGSEVADRETDQAVLRLSGKSILDNLNTQANALRLEWQYLKETTKSGLPRTPGIPLTLLELFYSDVTNKTKSVALSAAFGPSYEAGIEHLIKLVSAKGQDVSGVRASLNRIIMAKDPDDLTT